MFQDTVTVFNRLERDGETLWYPTVLRDVELTADEAAVTARYGYQRGDKALLMIHFAGTKAAPTAGGKSYLTPKNWRAAEDPAGAFTFQTGAVFDFFLAGAWEGGSPVRDGDWPRGFYEHMNRTRDGVWAVTGAAQYAAVPHFEVTGR